MPPTTVGGPPNRPSSRTPCPDPPRTRPATLSLPSWRRWLPRPFAARQATHPRRSSADTQYEVVTLLHRPGRRRMKSG
jgi:hypothetical protein